jgi:hypothetical protein
MGSPRRRAALQSIVIQPERPAAHQEATIADPPPNATATKPYPRRRTIVRLWLSQGENAPALSWAVIGLLAPVVVAVAIIVVGLIALLTVSA